MRVRAVVLTSVTAAALAAFAAGPGVQPALVSVGAPGTGSGGTFPSISAKGRFVVYETGATVGALPDTNVSSDVVLRNLRTGAALPVNVNAAGTAIGNGGSGSASVSADGRYVAFRSLATDLVAEPVTGLGDIYVRDMKTGTTRLVSVGTDGEGGATGADLPCAGCVISANGRRVAFYSQATNLTGVPSGGRPQVYVRDLRRGTTTMVSVNAAGTAGGNGLDAPSSFHGTLSLSADGRYVAFGNFSTDLTADTVAETGDVYLRDTKKGTTTLVSVAADGNVAGNGQSRHPCLSPNGRYVAFESEATTLTSLPVPQFSAGVYVHDLRRRTTVAASVTADGASVPALGSYGATLGRSGRVVCFSCDSDTLTTGDANGSTDVFLRDLRRGVTTLLSVDSTGQTSGNAYAEYSRISDNERIVVYTTAATNVTSDTVSGSGDVFVRAVR